MKKIFLFLILITLKSYSYNLDKMDSQIDQEIKIHKTRIDKADNKEKKLKIFNHFIEELRANKFKIKSVKDEDNEKYNLIRLRINKFIVYYSLIDQDLLLKGQCDEALNSMVDRIKTSPDSADKEVIILKEFIFEFCR